MRITDLHGAVATDVLVSCHRLLCCVGAAADAFASTFGKGHNGAAIADASASAAALGSGGVALADASAEASSKGGFAGE
jgi:hypothetical protein